MKFKKIRAAPINFVTYLKFIIDYMRIFSYDKFITGGKKSKSAYYKPGFLLFSAPPKVLPSVIKSMNDKEDSHAEA